MKIARWAIAAPLLLAFSFGLSAAFAAGDQPITDVTFVIEPAFDWAGPFSDGRAPVKTAGGWGYINTSGRIVIGPAFEEADPFRDGVARVVSGGMIGFIDRSGDYRHRAVA